MALRRKALLDAQEQKPNLANFLAERASKSNVLNLDLNIKKKSPSKKQTEKEVKFKDEETQVIERPNAGKIIKQQTQEASAKRMVGRLDLKKLSQDYRTIQHEPSQSYVEEEKKAGRIVPIGRRDLRGRQPGRIYKQP